MPISFLDIQSNPNLYFGSNPSFLCPFPLSIFKQIQICTSAQSHDFSVDFLYVYVSKSKSVLCLNPMIFLLISFIHQKRSKSVLQLSPIFFLSNSTYTFNEIQICTSANHMIFLLISFIKEYM